MCPATLHTLCAESVSPAQYGASLICRHGREDAAVASSFGRPHAKRTRTELPLTHLLCSSFPRAPLGPLDLPVRFFKQFAAAHIYIYRILLMADGPQRARLPVQRTAALSSCLWSRSVFPCLTLSATEARKRIKDLFLSRIELSTPHE